LRTPANWAQSLAAWSARNLPQPIIERLYRLKPLASVIRGVLNRTTPSGYSVVPIAAGKLEGQQMLLDLQFEKDYWLGTYEPHLQTAIFDLAKTGTTAYDIGANIGYISLMFAQAVGEAGKVYAFEALPENLDRLAQNLALNHLEERVEIVPGAVVDANKSVRFIVGHSGSTGKAQGSAGRDLQEDQIIEVNGLSLDKFIYHDGNPAPAIIKMDIEGGEVQALPGMHRLLLEHGPAMMLELHGPESARAVWDILSECGYRIASMDPGYPQIRSLENLNWKAYVIATR
jgi:FkbM family methyltransferase